MIVSVRRPGVACSASVAARRNASWNHCRALLIRYLWHSLRNLVRHLVVDRLLLISRGRDLLLHHSGYPDFLPAALVDSNGLLSRYWNGHRLSLHAVFGPRDVFVSDDRRRLNLRLHRELRLRWQSLTAARIDVAASARVACSTAEKSVIAENASGKRNGNNLRKSQQDCRHRSG